MLLSKTLHLISYFILFDQVYMKCERENHIVVPKFKIDLDKPAHERFKEPSLYFKQNILEWLSLEKKRYNFFEFSVLEFIASQFDRLFPYPFNQEIKGIAEVLGTNVGDVVLANLIYDFTAFCTSIVAKNENGELIHGRNLDYDFSESLQNLTYIAEFYRNESLLFTSAQLAGYIGVVTGHKYKSFTFSINERDQGEWWNNIIFGLFDRRATPLSFLTRKVMENVTNFDKAVEIFKTNDLIAPAYFILAGTKPNEGVVLTRSQFHLVDAWNLSDNNWYLLETNYDHRVPPPSSDDRRTPGMKAMNQTTQANINGKTLMDVLSINPVCNKDTVYSVVMTALREKDDYGFNIIIH